MISISILNRKFQLIRANVCQIESSTGNIQNIDLNFLDILKNPHSLLIFSPQLKLCLRIQGLEWRFFMCFEICDREYSEQYLELWSPTFHSPSKPEYFLTLPSHLMMQVRFMDSSGRESDFLKSLGFLSAPAGPVSSCCEIAMSHLIISLFSILVFLTGLLS